MCVCVCVCEGQKEKSKDFVFTGMYAKRRGVTFGINLGSE